MPDGQLRALAAVGAALDQAGLDWWLFGGWGVDFWVGHATREHDDVDLVVRRADREAAAAVLRGLGATDGEVDDPAIGAAYELGGVRVELTLVGEGASGSVVLPFDAAPFTWWPEPFGEQRRTLDGVTARVVPRALLMRDKAAGRGDDDAAADKDAADLRALLG